jgi:transcriptional regulator with XRE-family HTH domain
MVHRAELASFLRARREATDPVALGLNPGPRRRTPGLRREEVAQLSGVSVTWYTWLEQARDITVSRQVIDSLARVLRLPPEDRAHMFTLAGLVLPAESPVPPQVDGTLRRLTHELNPNPACVISVWWDLLVVNEAYAVMIGGLEHRPQPERNSLWLTFTGSQTRGLYVDWEDEARQLVDQLRIQLAQHPTDTRGPRLVENLQHASPQFAELWQEPPVRHFHSSRKRFRHPEAGRIDLDYIKLASDGDTYLIAFLPSDAVSAERLRELQRPR